MALIGLAIDSRSESDAPSTRVEALMEALAEQSAFTPIKCIQYLDSVSENRSVFAQQLPWYDAIARLDFADLEPFEALLWEKRRSAYWSEVDPILYYRWCVEDPSGFLAFAAKPESRQRVESRLSFITRFTTWHSPRSSFELMRALGELGYPVSQPMRQIGFFAARFGDSEIAKLSNEYARSADVPDLFSVDDLRDAIEGRLWESDSNRWNQLLQMAGSDPEKVVRSFYENTMGTSGQVRGLLQTAISGWVGKDPFEALDFLWQSGADKSRFDKRYIQEAMRSTMLKDFSWTMEWMQANMSPHVANRSLVELAGSGNVGIELMPYLQAMPESQQKRNAVVALWTNWARRDFDTALEWGRSHLSERQYLESRIALIGHDAGRRLEQDVAFVESISSWQQKTNATSRLVQVWSSHDFDGALDWVLGQSDSAAKESALMHLSYQWAQQDLETLRSFRETLDDGNLKSTLTLAIANGMQQGESWEETMSYAEELENPMERDRLRSQLINDLSNRDPYRALETIDSYSNWTENTQERLRQNALNRLANFDIDAAAQYVSKMSENQELTLSALSVGNQFLEFDLKGAIDWMSTLPPSDMRDQMIGHASTIERHVQNDPETILESIDLIKNPSLKRNALQNLETFLGGN